MEWNSWSWRCQVFCLGINKLNIQVLSGQQMAWLLWVLVHQLLSKLFFVKIDIHAMDFDNANTWSYEF